MKRTKKVAKKKPVLRASEVFAPRSKYLKGTEVPEPFVTTVTGIESAEFDDGERWVLSLEACKPVILNATNGQRLGEDLGDDMEEWIGQDVQVFTEKVRNPQTGKLGPAVRLCGAEPADDTDEYEEEE